MGRRTLVLASAAALTLVLVVLVGFGRENDAPPASPSVDNAAAEFEPVHAWVLDGGLHEGSGIDPAPPTASPVAATSAARADRGTRASPIPVDAEQRAHFAALNTRYDEYFEGESKDDSWAEAKEQEVLDFLETVVGVSDFSVDCRTTLCRAQFTFDDESAALDFRDAVSRPPFTEGRGNTRMFPPDYGNSLAVHFYFARQDERIPIQDIEAEL